MTHRHQSLCWLLTLLLGLLWLPLAPADAAQADPVRDLVAECMDAADGHFPHQRLIPPDAEAIRQAWGVLPGAIAPPGHVVLPKGLNPAQDPALAYRITRSPPFPSRTSSGSTHAPGLGLFAWFLRPRWVSFWPPGAFVFSGLPPFSAGRAVISMMGTPRLPPRSASGTGVSG